MSMKSFLSCLICFLLQLTTHAQDTIYKRSGELISAKVLEINTKEISYKRFDLLEGPLYIANKNDIKKIKYATGTIDSFAVVASQLSTVLYVSRPKKYNYPENYDQITTTFRRGIYRHQGHYLSDRGVAFLAMEKNQVWKNQEIELNIMEARRNKAIQYSIGLGGLFVGGVGLFSSALYSDSNNSSQLTGLTALASAGIIVASEVISFQFKLKRIKNTNKVAELYNSLSK